MFLEVLGSGIGTGSGFCHSFLFSNNVQCAIKLLWKLKVRGYGTLLYNQIISRMTFYFKYPNSYVSMMLSSSLRLVSLIRSSSLSSIGLEKISFLHLKNLFNFPIELNRFWSGSGLKITGSAIDDNKSPNFL